MGSYSVVTADGQMYGPTDEATLAQWAREGRIDASTVLHSHDTGQRMWANSVQSLGAGSRLVAGRRQYDVAAPVASRTVGGFTRAMPAGIQYAGPMTGYAGHSLTRFPVAGTVLLSYITFGIFPWIHFGLMHDKMPKNRPDDPSAVKAILFHLIPFFNFYWLFFERLRLMDRVDEQRRFAGLPPAAPKGFFIAASVMLFVPFANYVSILILLPIVIGLCQSQVNGLVDATRGGQ